VNVVDVEISERPSYRRALAHDASHYLLIPDAVAAPRDAREVAALFLACRDTQRRITFRSGGTSLSGQASSSSLLVDTRRHFRQIEIVDDGARVRVQPGATVRQVNARLARFGRKLGPDPASEIACTIGGVIANNSSGMACGTAQNTYNTLESMTFVLASGTTIDSAQPDADDLLREREPALHAELTALRTTLVEDVPSSEIVRRQFRIKNTMGYGINALLDFERPIDILVHLLIGSEGTLGFVAEAVFHTVPLHAAAATGLLVFANMDGATGALPRLVEAGFATIELMDSLSLAVAQRQSDCPKEIADLEVVDQAALLVELQAANGEELAGLVSHVSSLLGELATEHPARLSTDSAERASLWHVRKVLYTAVAGSRPSGTTALLEDVAVPVSELLGTCRELTSLFERYGYEGCVIFGHAKDGNIHFMLNERFDVPESLDRYRRFTDDMVDLVLGHGGNLKAEHGTGRIMAPFVRRQYGDALYSLMRSIKAAFDPTNMLNPGVLITDDAESHLHDLKSSPRVEAEVDRCVECGYCEQACPSRDLTLTPRQRIVLRREMETARVLGETELLAELEADYEYDGVETCAVDGMCGAACPVDINTGDLVRRLRAERQGSGAASIAAVAAGNWSGVTRMGGIALTVAAAVPSPIVVAATKIARAAVGSDVVPLYDDMLPAGGRARRRLVTASPSPAAVYFPACVGTMFGPEPGGQGVQDAFVELCARANIEIMVPPDIESACCGTPWKSKGFADGYTRMSERVLPMLFDASDGGRLPIVCDAASCTEGLETMRAIALEKGGAFDHLRFVDSIEFVATTVLPALDRPRPRGSVAVHPTCSTSALGVNERLGEIAEFFAEEVVVPTTWGCCAFAGDRGLLHPELTASATRDEAEEVNLRRFDEYVSANRTCELGMTRATGHAYRHVLEVLAERTRG
jgi:D-lactate dehydrogenase